MAKDAIYTLFLKFKYAKKRHESPRNLKFGRIISCSGPNENKDHQEITGQQQQHISKDSLAAAKRVIRKDTIKAGIIKRIDSIPKSKRENDKIKREKKEIHKHLAPGQTTIDSIKKAKGEKKFNKE